MTQKNNVYGFSLFNDVEDLALRTKNRAQIMHNILVDHTDEKGMVRGEGVTIVHKYFTEIAESERGGVLSHFKALTEKPSAI